VTKYRINYAVGLHYYKKLNSKFWSRKSQNINKPIIVLASNWDNYGHFLIEHLMKLVIINNLSKTLPDKKIVIVVESPCPKWKLDLISIIANIDYEIFELDSHVDLIGSTYISTYPSYNYELFTTARQTILSKLQIKNTKEKLKLYISRKLAKDRKILNEDEIIEQLTVQGFTVIYPELLSINEQISLFSNADTVLGMHGSGLANIIFCENVKLIELMPCAKFNTMFFGISMVLGFKYVSISTSEQTSKGKDSDAYFDPLTLIKYTKRLDK
ncbi:glycosyltransferase family 61 protein, partial [Amylibacter sp.]|nr:glycosyltransferase family 61 protein [Amylibacter sp.]